MNSLFDVALVRMQLLRKHVRALVARLGRPRRLEAACDSVPRQATMTPHGATRALATAASRRLSCISRVCKGPRPGTRLVVEARLDYVGASGDQTGCWS